MTTTATQIMNKRSIKPKTQYSPSNPTIITKYHLIVYDDTKNMMIVSSSSVKRFGSDGTIKLNNGRTAKLISSGTKDECMERWNKQIDSSRNKTNGKTFDDDDESSNDMEPTLLIPANSFSTPARNKRQKTVATRSDSPDSTLSDSSPKRFAQKDPRRCSKTSNNKSSRENGDRTSKGATISVTSSSDDEDVIHTSHAISMNRLFDELQNTQTNIQDIRTDNNTIHQQLTNIAKKISHFSSLVLSKNDQELDRYRDVNVKENFKSEIIHDGRDLLQVAAKSVGEYARSLLKILFKPHELQSSLLPSQQSKRYSKPELDHERFNLLNEAVRTRYRITNYHYSAFYKERIQETLAGCLYNEGTRKLKKQAAQQQQQQQVHDNSEPNSPEIDAL